MNGGFIFLIFLGSLAGIFVLCKICISCSQRIILFWIFGLKHWSHGRSRESTRPRHAGLDLQFLPPITEQNPGTQSDIVSLSGVTVCGTEEDQ